MNYSVLKKEIGEIADIANSVPESFREKCFEILLTHLLVGLQPQNPSQTKPDDSQNPIATSNPEPNGNSIPMKAQLRVFLQRTGVTEEELNAVVMFDEGDVYFIREPLDSAVATGQIQWALLLSLKSCILNGAFSVDPEDVRSICQEKGYYDSSNFSKNFKHPSNARLFKNALQPQGSAETLSGDGQNELAKLIKALASNGK